MIRDLKQFKRESANRHKSERNLDKNLYQFSKKLMNKKIKDLKENPHLNKEVIKKMKESENLKAKIEDEDKSDSKTSMFIS